MDIRFLATFLEVAHTRHFGKAAEHLFLTQSAVSARIKLLEEYFGTALFIRNRNSIQLSPAGEKLMPYAQELHHTLQQAKNALNQSQLQHLSIACTQNAYYLFAAKKIGALQAHVQPLSCKVEVCGAEQISRQLHEHVIDIGFSTQALKSDDIVSLALPELELGLFSACGQDLDSAFTHYVHIDWSAKVSELLFKTYPQTRQNTMSTSALEVALPMLKNIAATALLPLKHKALSKYERLTLPSDIQEQLRLPCFMHYVKGTEDTSAKDIIDFLSHN